eukprot:6187064-Pleurochrysis_carterae.AAC.1
MGAAVPQVLPHNQPGLEASATKEVERSMGAQGDTSGSSSENVEPMSAAPALVGQRVREKSACARHGIIFSENVNHFAVAFDDLNWRSYPSDKFIDEFAILVDEDDGGYCDAVRSVLLERKGNLNLACGFYLGSSAKAAKPTANGWEVFEKYMPAPYERCPTRYADPALDFTLQFGDVLDVKPPFASPGGGKVGMELHMSFSARVVCLLLGGNWNSTKKHLDKRRWVLVERDEHFYFLPLDNAALT